MKDVIILGAGLSGWGCVHVLTGARVYEKKDHPGGHAWSHVLNGVSFDEGAHIAHSKDPEWRARLLALGDSVHRIGQSRVTNFWHGHWITYPVQNHLCELPVEERTAALVDFMHAQMEHQGQTPANYREWCLFQYGRFLTERFYCEYTTKYWRVPMEELATDWLSGRLLPSQADRIVAGALAPMEERQSAFAEFLYPAAGGFYAFFKEALERLPVTYNAAAVRVDSRRREIAFSNGQTESYRALASSIPLPELVRIISDAPEEIRDAAAALRHLQLLCVNMIIRRPALTPAHWFYIYDPDVEVSRVSVIGNLAPNSAPPGHTVLQAEIFRRRDESMDSASLGDKAVRNVARVLGFDSGREVEAVGQVHVPYSYVISDLNRASSVDTIIPWLEARDIYPMGLFGRWKFMWSDVAFRSGIEAGERIRKRLARGVQQPANH